MSAVEGEPRGRVERRAMRLRADRRAMLLVAILIALASTVAVFAFRGGDAPSLVAHDGSETKPPAQEIRCHPGELGLVDHYDDVDLRGGPTTAATAMEEWLSLNSYGLTLEDVVAVDPGGTNPQYAEYEYRTEGSPIARFSVNFVGDSWAVTDWEACAGQIGSIIRSDDAPD